MGWGIDNPKTFVDGKIIRKYSTMNANDIRFERECGAQEANKICSISRMLDKLENAQHLNQVIEVVSDFITRETGVK